MRSLHGEIFVRSLHGEIFVRDLRDEIFVRGLHGEIFVRDLHGEIFVCVVKDGSSWCDICVCGKGWFFMVMLPCILL